MIDNYEKLLKTSLSMREQCKNEHWQSVFIIEQQRQKLINIIKQDETTGTAECYATIKKIIDCNSEIESILTQYKEKQQNRIGSLRKAQKNSSAYQSAKNL